MESVWLVHAHAARDRDASVARFCAKYAPVGNLTITHHTYKVGPPSYKMVYKPH